MTHGSQSDARVPPSSPIRTASAQARNGLDAARGKAGHRTRPSPSSGVCRLVFQEQSNRKEYADAPDTLSRGAQHRESPEAPIRIASRKCYDEATDTSRRGHCRPVHFGRVGISNITPPFASSPPSPLGVHSSSRGAMARHSRAILRRPTDALELGLRHQRKCRGLHEGSARVGRRAWLSPWRCPVPLPAMVQLGRRDLLLALRLTSHSEASNRPVSRRIEIREHLAGAPFLFQAAFGKAARTSSGTSLAQSKENG